MKIVFKRDEISLIDGGRDRGTREGGREGGGGGGGEGRRGEETKKMEGERRREGERMNIIGKTMWVHTYLLYMEPSF